MAIRIPSFFLSVLLWSSHSLASQVPAPPAQAGAQVRAGAQLYQQHCALCHGANGQGEKVFPRPIWGQRSVIGKFSTEQGLFEFLQMMMPLDDPARVSDDDKTAIVAYMLVRNGSLQAGASIPAGGSQASIKKP